MTATADVERLAAIAGASTLRDVPDSTLDALLTTSSDTPQNTEAKA